MVIILRVARSSASKSSKFLLPLSPTWSKLLQRSAELHLSDRLPLSIRVILEAAIRNCDDFRVKKSDVENIMNWEKKQKENTEIPFQPARVVLQDFTGVPVVVDLATMLDAVQKLKGDPKKINLICPTDLVVDHSVQVDFFGERNALEKNQEIEFERNKELFQFLKWGAKAFKNMIIVPPGSGIVHQVNLEYLARVVFTDQNVLYPDSLVGTDSHTTMICGLGVLGWVQGIHLEAAAAAEEEEGGLQRYLKFSALADLQGSPIPDGRQFLVSLQSETDVMGKIEITLKDTGGQSKKMQFQSSIEGMKGGTLKQRVITVPWELTRINSVDILYTRNLVLMIMSATTWQLKAIRVTSIEDETVTNLEKEITINDKVVKSIDLK